MKIFRLICDDGYFPVLTEDSAALRLRLNMPRTVHTRRSASTASNEKVKSISEYSLSFSISYPKTVYTIVAGIMPMPVANKNERIFIVLRPAA